MNKEERRKRWVSSPQIVRVESKELTIQEITQYIMNNASKDDIEMYINIVKNQAYADGIKTERRRILELISPCDNTCVCEM